MAVCGVILWSNRGFDALGNEPFSLVNVHGPTVALAKWDVPPPPAVEREQIETILKAPFHYLGQGHQSYVFLSDDRQYVLKFIKHQRLRPAWFVKALRHLPVVDRWANKQMAAKRRRQARIYGSWKLAYEKLAAETGVIYAHLNPTGEWRRQIQVIDDTGARHSIDADSTAFLIQKRADGLLADRLKELLDRGQREEACQLVQSLVAMLRSELQRGIWDYDHTVFTNTGLVGNQPFHLDVGMLMNSQRVATDPALQQRKFKDNTRDLVRFLREQQPQLDLAGLFDQGTGAPHLLESRSAISRL